MRDILFRGQTRRKGERVRMGDGKPLKSHWVYGGIFPQNNGGDFAIIYSQEPVEKFTVYADTVGQYIGLNDKRNHLIFDGDNVRYLDEVTGKDKICTIRWHEDFASFAMEYKSKMGLQYMHISKTMANKCEIIGNIYDNPELLGKESETEIL